MPGPLLALLAAAAPAPAAPAPAPSWRVDREESRCILERDGGESQPTLTVRFIPGERSSEIWMSDPRWEKEDLAGPETISLFLDAPGVRPVGSFRAVEAPGRVKALVTEGGGRDFLEALPQSHAAIVRKGEREIFRIPLPNAATALAATRACEDDLLAKWGVDPAAFHALRSPPKLPPGTSWIRADDYPSMAAGAQGTIVARLDIDAGGKVTACAVVAGSGSPPLDRATCNAARRRGRYQPAIGPDGSPVATATIAHNTWHLYEMRP